MFNALNVRHALAGAALALSMPAALAQLTWSASAPDAATLQPVVDAFRAHIGTLNPNNPGSLGAGRREINWDGAPDTVSAANAFPGGFFNRTNAPLARGTVFCTPGTGFQLSSRDSSGVAVEYGNINPTYPAEFAVFSPQRLFTAIDSNVCDVEFRVPGTDEEATVPAFGALFTDVDLAGVTSMEFFDLHGQSLGKYDVVPGPTSAESLSFLAIAFNEPVIRRVRITSGNSPLGPDEDLPEVDVVVMDDFIFGEPIAIEAPCAGDLDGDGLVGLTDLAFFLSALYGTSCF